MEMSSDNIDREEPGEWCSVEVISEEFLYQKSSQQLTAILYEGCIQHLDDAVAFINGKKYLDANEKLKQANDILHRLGTGLKYEAGVIAEQLDTLYNYMANRLIEANMKKDVTIIQEVKQMLETISSAWNEAMTNAVDQPVKRAVQQRLSSYEQNIATIPIK